ncbi:MAG: PAS domain S-box protein [Polyangiaceae bacterium]|nr:PAS domain S-box protein [Polyangiaceae bacterium]
MDFDENNSNENDPSASPGAGASPSSGNPEPTSRPRIAVPPDMVLEAAPDAMVVVDSSGSIIYVNGEAEKLFGYGRAELVDMPIESLIPTAKRAAHVEVRNSFYARPHARPMGAALNIVAQRKDGSVFPADVKLSPLKTPSGILITAAVRDISDRKRAEEQLRTYAAHLERLQARLEHKNIELEQRNSELEQFAYVSSHDLQEPLRKIIAFGDRLKARCGDALDERSLDYLARIQNASSRMQQLINDLLEFSRLSTRGRAFEPVSLSSVTAAAISDLELAIEHAGGRVEITGVDELPAIDGDPVQLRQVLQNLIGNAVKFRRKNVPPIVKVAGRVLTGEDGQPQVELTVEDNGIGIEARFTERIFTVFERLHSRESYEGTGIGLAVCKKIAERHGGKIFVKSEFGSGSTFVMRLPIQHTERGH